jgi:drug/metabolite transporter (DMT)-like permease
MAPVQRREPLQTATIAAIVVAVVAVSSSAPIIAFAAAPALAIAFWRNAAASAVLWPVAATRRRDELGELARPKNRSALIGCVLAGCALAAHFATWIPSVKLTSVADAVALCAIQPVWQGLIAMRQGRQLPRVMWVGVGLAVAGAVVATGADFGVSHRAVVGDLLAIVGGMAAAVYTAFGERARVATSTITYTTICYSVCAVLLVVVCLIGGVQMTGFSGSTWLAIAGLVIGAQLLGHSMFNYALEHVSATTVAVLILLEIPGASLLAWLWLGQTPNASSIPGLLLLVAGVVTVLLGSRTVVPLAVSDVD